MQGGDGGGSKESENNAKSIMHTMSRPILQYSIILKRCLQCEVDTQNNGCLNWQTFLCMPLQKILVNVQCIPTRTNSL